MINKHPSWFSCKDCNAVFLDNHPKRCHCGSRKFTEVMTEDIFTVIGLDDHDDCTEECEDRNKFDLYRRPER